MNEATGTVREVQNAYYAFVPSFGAVSLRGSQRGLGDV
jgi:hypothetical protein